MAKKKAANPATAPKKQNSGSKAFDDAIEKMLKAKPKK